MNVSLYQAAAALDGNIRWQQMIAENLAASSTPGFKKRDISFSTVEAGVIGAPTDPFSTKRTLLPTPNFAINFNRGALLRTGVKSNLAVEGDGFFSVRMQNGQVAYTRDGEFRISPEGVLVNKSGYDLLGEGGGQVRVDPRGGTESLTISPEGNVSQGGIIRGRIGMVEFTPEDRQKLRPIGGGYYLPTDDTVQPGPAESSYLSQGFVEASNTLPPAEMSSLLLALRHFEANQKVIQMQDERMGKTIQELSATS